MGETGNFAGESFFVEGIHLHFNRIAKLNILDVIHCDGKIQPQQVVVGDTHQRHVLRIRRNERARISVAMGDDAVKGRGDLGVTDKCLVFFNPGVGGRNGGVGGQIVGLGGVEILLGHQIGMIMVDRLQPGVNQVCIGVIRLGLLQSRLCIVQFSLQFRHFKRGH